MKIYPKKVLEALKYLIIDIHFFILFLKECPYFIEKIKFYNNIYAINALYGNICELYRELQEVLKINFCQNYEDYEEIKIVRVYPILEKKLILLFTLKDVKFYNIKLNKITFSIKQEISEAKIYKINSGKLSIHLKHFLFFMCIKYDSFNKPINIYTQYFENKKIVKIYFHSVNVIDENNIIVCDNKI